MGIGRCDEWGIAVVRKMTSDQIVMLLYVVQLLKSKFEPPLWLQVNWSGSATTRKLIASIGNTLGFDRVHLKVS